jgi:hypothetical protein
LQTEAGNKQDDCEHENESVESTFAVKGAVRRRDRRCEPTESKDCHRGNHRQAANHHNNHEKCPAWLDALFTNVIAFDAVFPEPFGAVVAEIDEEHDLDEQKNGGTKCLEIGGSVIGFMYILRDRVYVQTALWGLCTEGGD